MPRSEALTVIQREMEWRKANERCQYYEPNEPVTKFIELVGTKDNLIFTLSAANGIGKTTALVNIAASIMFGPQNRYFDKPLFRDWKYPKRLRFVSEASQIKDGGPFPTEVKKWWPRGRYKPGRNGQGYDAIYKSGDWSLEVMTYDQLPAQHEGANLGCILFNEPPPENLWTPNISRLRAGGIAVIGMTPLTEAGWFFDKVVPRHQDFIVYADVETACKQHGTRGHLEHSDIEKMIAEYSDEEREARIEGKALYLKGLIYKTFNHQVHVLKETIEAPSNATLYQSVDPHTDKPFACIWAFVDGKGDIYIVDEWPNVDFNKWHGCQIGIEEYVSIFRQKERGMRVHKRIIDRHFADVRSAVNKRTLREELRDLTNKNGQHIGMDFEASYQAAEEIETGILRVKDYLKYNPDRPLDTTNKPKLFINPHCQNTIKSFLRWSYDPKTNKPQDSYKDFMDVVRYLVMDSPEVDVPIPYEPAKKRW